MNGYDPDRGPDPEEWLARDEQERIDRVFEYHLQPDPDHPAMEQPMAHAVIQAAVETQVALADATPVAAKLAQLMDEGLDRHEALHAIGSVLAGFLWEMLGGKVPEGDADEVNAAYFRQLEPLTAESWLSQAEPPDDEESVS